MAGNPGKKQALLFSFFLVAISSILALLVASNHQQPNSSARKSLEELAKDTNAVQGLSQQMKALAPSSTGADNAENTLNNQAKRQEALLDAESHASK